MSVTAAEWLKSMTAQLRLLAPAMSAATGTPENQILSVVAQALSEGSTNVNTLAGGLDVSSKVGGNLDRFLALFGFARQTATQATGFVTFSCNVSPSQDIVIPANTPLFATITSPSSTTGSTQSIIYFITQFQGTIPAESTSKSVTVPVIAQIAGSSGNVEANTITSFAKSPVFGVSSVTNKNPTTGGVDEEGDAELQTRFQNTVFRNLAGTEDQYLGIIASTPYTTQAQVIGPMSRYQEYIQVPPVDDSQSYEFINASGEAKYPTGNSTVSGTYTTALSTVPNSKYIYTNVPTFVTNGQTGANTVFYRQGIDWILNTEPPAKNHGDAFRFWEVRLPGAENPQSLSLPALTRPNISFINVYRGTDTGVQSVKPEQVVLFEHAYTSTASRNSVTNNVTNAVDIYVDGANNTVAQTVVASPGISQAQAFNTTPGSYLYYQNYQRYGEPGSPPSIGNILFPLYNEPVTAIPNQITITGEVLPSGVLATTFYQLGTHYYLVQDVTNLFGTVRCRNGIEFNPNFKGNATNLNDGTGYRLNEYVAGISIPISGYTYDKNIVDLQAACESAKQINTDVLVHKAYIRYFKLDLTVIYAAGANASAVNSSIQSTVASYFARQTFGSLIQTGSIIQSIFAVPGVQDVRWSADLPFGPVPGDNRITETNINGLPIIPTSIDPAIFNIDFFLADNQLASLPTGALATDTLPGLIIRPRANNSWIRGPYNPAFNPNLPITPPD